jgi:hypothetical protein
MRVPCVFVFAPSENFARLSGLSWDDKKDGTMVLTSSKEWRRTTLNLILIVLFSLFSPFLEVKKMQPVALFTQRCISILPKHARTKKRKKEKKRQSI